MHLGRWMANQGLASCPERGIWYLQGLALKEEYYDKLTTASYKALSLPSFQLAYSAMIFSGIFINAASSGSL